MRGHDPNHRGWLETAPRRRIRGAILRNSRLEEPFSADRAGPIDRDGERFEDREVLQ
jgi:hypothetical protein